MRKIKKISINKLVEKLKKLELKGKMVCVNIVGDIDTMLFLEGFESLGIDKKKILTLYSNEDDARVRINTRSIICTYLMDEDEEYAEVIIELDNGINIQIYNQ